jgi:dihydrofolate reductase
LLTKACPDFAERLRAEKGKDIRLLSGAEPVAAFLESEQVDEFIVGIPLVVPRRGDNVFLASTFFGGCLVQYSVYGTQP